MKLRIILFIFCIVLFPLSTLGFDNFQNNLNSVLDSIKHTISDIIEKSNITEQCSSDLKLYITDLYGLKPWALQMFDATGKLAPGFAYGNQELVGNYDECLSIDEGHIKGQLCTIILELQKNYTILYLEELTQWMKFPNFNYLANSFFKSTHLTWDICVPKSCSSDGLNNISTLVKERYGMPLLATANELSCVYKDKVIIEPFQTDLLIFIFFGILLSIVIFSTAYDIYLQKTASKGHNILIIFSLSSNIKSLLSVNQNQENLTCLHGIKVINMIWIITGHMFFQKSITGSSNTVFIAFEWREALINAFILATPLAVDVFFVLSGLLVIYIYLKRTKTSKINLVPFYLHRYFRLAPALFGTVLFHSAIFKYLPAGRKFPHISKYVSLCCSDGWWMTLTFTQNWADEHNDCVDQAWYLSVDYQLYLFAPIILFNIRKHPIKVLMLMVSISFISFVVIFYRLFKYQLGFLLVFEIDVHYNEIYNSIFLRFPSWLLGTFYGYMIYVHKMKRYKITKTFNLILWLFSLTTMLGIVLYHNVYAREKEYSPIRSGMMQTFGRFFWCFAVCNLIYSLSTGHGRFINAFLAHPVFIVLSKLSYCMFLMEMWVIYWVLSYQKQGREFTNFQNFFEFCGDISIILFSSVVLHLFFEMPFALLMKHAAQGEKASRIKSSSKMHPE